MTGHRAPEGIDSARIDAWLAAHVPDVSPPFRYELITGGRSNLTYCATDAAGRKLVVRRPPLGTLLATAHDVVREFRIAAALADTPVPVAPALAVCDDAAVNGTPFAVTGFVEGIVLDSTDKVAPVPEDARRELAFHLIDVLAELHSVDLDAVGLSDLSRHEGYIERQLRRWSKQWGGSKTRELALIDDVGRLLSERIPAQGRATIVHGDYRFGNCIVDFARRRVVAVLDWELCTLGDPLADLGHMGIYWHDPRHALPITNDPTSVGGFPSFAALLARYADRTGRDVGNIEYYRAFAAWRLAIIAEGVAARHLARHADDTAALHGSQLAVQRLAEFASNALDQPN